MDCDGLRGMDAWKGFDSTPKDGSRYCLVVVLEYQ